MTNKKTDINELTQQCLDAERTFKALQAQLEQAKKEEEEAKQAKLEADRQKRYDAVVSAYKKFENLRAAYVNDYGYFTMESTGNNGDFYKWFWNVL